MLHIPRVRRDRRFSKPRRRACPVKAPSKEFRFEIEKSGARGGICTPNSPVLSRMPLLIGPRERSWAGRKALKVVPTAGVAPALDRV